MISELIDAVAPAAAPAVDHPEWPEVERLLTEGEDTATTLGRGLYMDLFASFEQPESVYAEITSKLTGPVHMALEDATSIAVKAIGKVNKAVDQSLSNAYSYAQDGGMLYPTLDQVRIQSAGGGHLEQLYRDGAPSPQPAPAVSEEPPAVFSLPGGSMDDPPAPAVNATAGPSVGVSWWYCPETAAAANVAQMLPKPFNRATNVGPHSPIKVVPGANNLKWYAFADSPGVDPEGLSWLMVSYPFDPGTGVIESRYAYGPPGAYACTAPDGSYQIGLQTGGMVPGQTSFYTNQIGTCPSVYGEQQPTNPNPGPTNPPTDPTPPGDPTGGGGGSCRAPKVPDCHAPEWPTPVPAPVNDDPCDLVNGYLNLSTSVGNFLSTVIRWGTEGSVGGILVENIVGSITGVKEPIMVSLSNWIQQQAAAGVKFFGASVNAAGATERLVAACGIMTGYNFLNKWTGLTVPQAEADMIRRVNATMPYKLPSGGQADMLYMADEITKDQWRCFHEMDGSVVKWQEKVIHAGRTRLSPDQITELYRRQKISLTQWVDEMRQLGVTELRDRQRFLDRQQAQPQLQDVIRFMVRDVADKNIIDRFDLDSQFPDKWTGDLVKYGEQLGVTPDLAKYYWRAHWEIPSYTQLTEMMYRNRPGRVPEELEVTPKDVEDAITQNDMLPFWVKRMMNIGYQPLTRTDLSRAYAIRAVDDAELKSGLMDGGYQDADADILVRFYRRQRKLARVRTMGRLTPRIMVGKYAKGYISRSDLETYYLTLEYTLDEVDEALKFADLERSYQNRQAIVTRTKGEYRSGLIGPDVARNALINSGISLAEANMLISQWAPAKSPRSKQVSATQLCAWRSKRIITPEQQLQALIRVGYESIDAHRIVETCEAELTEKEMKAVAAAQEKARKEGEKAAKELAKKQLDYAKAVKKARQKGDPEPEPWEFGL